MIRPEVKHSPHNSRGAWSLPSNQTSKTKPVLGSLIENTKGVSNRLDENDSKKVCPYEPQKDSTTETENQSIEELDEVEKALEVVQNFAVKHWMPCLRDCCGDGLYKVEELKEQLRNEQSND